MLHHKLIVIYMYQVVFIVQLQMHVLHQKVIVLIHILDHQLNHFAMVLKTD